MSKNRKLKNYKLFKEIMKVVFNDMRLNILKQTLIKLFLKYLQSKEEKTHFDKMKN
jgi:hypothetical protein